MSLISVAALNMPGHHRFDPLPPAALKSDKPSVSKIRLDCLLVERGFFDSREKAQRAILAGEVSIGGHRSDKPGTRVPSDCALEIQQKNRFVSRGGLKLEAALAHFGVDPAGLVCVDVGASTGGFTDCLLQHGAARVHALDVGHGQLDWKIRSDPRVAVQEKINARYLTPADLPEPATLGVVDVSFISLTMILPALAAIVEAGAGQGRGVILALIKPQFELERGEVGKGGIVREPALHERAIERVRRFVEESLPTWRWTGCMDSPILGAEGNKEFLACLRS
jgi:23S rRNA (cytidine1920-2'-O)/16S rRNA (cytidine1409-2'-O)-methyltransferase